MYFCGNTVGMLSHVGPHGLSLSPYPLAYGLPERTVCSQVKKRYYTEEEINYLTVCLVVRH